MLLPDNLIDIIQKYWHNVFVNRKIISYFNLGVRSQVCEALLTPKLIKKKDSYKYRIIKFYTIFMQKFEPELQISYIVITNLIFVMRYLHK